MSTIFILLFVGSLVALIVGLIKPGIVSKLIRGEASRKKVALIFSIATFVFLILGAATSPNTKVAEDKKVTQQTAAVFDVPALVGKNMDGLVATLGTPNKDNGDPTPEQLKLGTKIWWKSYEKDGRELLITYNPNTGEVIDLFIPASDAEHDNRDKSSLLAVGNLKEGDPKYSLEFVEDDSDASRFTGVKVIAAK